MKVKVIILAAGQGKRFKSRWPKVLVQFRGQPMVTHVVSAVEKSGVTDRPVVVVGVGAEHVRAALSDRCDYVYQGQQLGTGHAVAQCQPLLQNQAEAVLVLYGDHPLISGATIRQLVSEHERTRAMLTMGTVVVPDFEDWRQGFSNFGRIVRDAAGNLQRIVEVKDATAEEREIREINPSYFCFNAAWLWENIGKLGKNNAQGEYYLTDLLGQAIKQGRMVATVPIDPRAAVGVNSPEQLVQARNLNPPERLRFIFDLDHVLVDTTLFKQDLAESFAAGGIPVKLFWETLMPSYEIDPGTAGTHGIAKQLGLIGSKAGRATPAQIFADLSTRARRRGSGYLYPDVLPNLKFLQQQKIPCHLVTLGDPDEQRLKFTSSGLAPYFASFACTTQQRDAAGKISLMAKLAQSNETMVNVNDRPDELEAMAAAFPRARHFLIRRPDRPEQRVGPWTIVSGLDKILQTLGL